MLQVYEKVFNDEFREKLEKYVIKLSLFGFLIHLIVIGLNHYILSDLLGDFDLLKNPISAIYTPFSFILVSEVYLLIYYIPRSFTQSVAKQYEVVALIIIRKIFKDISNIDLITDWFSNEYNTKLTIDMACILLIFLLIGFFKQADQTTKKTNESEATKFIHSKKKVALALFFIFVLLSFYHLFTWSWASFQFVINESSHIPAISPIFYDDFFTILILMDVWLLILSFNYTSNYYTLMRNSGFIISTVLIRLGISSDSLISTIIMLFSIAFGWMILLLFKRFQTINSEVH